LPEWQGEPIEVTAQDPLACEWPDAVLRDGGAYFNEQAFRQLLICREVADGNAEVAGHNAQALRELQAAYNAVLEVGRTQKDLADYRIADADRQRRDATLEAHAWQAAVILAILLSL